MRKRQGVPSFGAPGPPRNRPPDALIPVAIGELQAKGVMRVCFDLLIR